MLEEHSVANTGRYRKLLGSLLPGAERQRIQRMRDEEFDRRAVAKMDEMYFKGDASSEGSALVAPDQRPVRPSCSKRLHWNSGARGLW